MVIMHNMLALNTKRQLGLIDNDVTESTVKLSSGYKINKAADDAAGLAISEKMRKQIRGLKQAQMNIDEGIGYVQVADGALGEVQDMLHRMTELSVKAANGTNSDSDRNAIDNEVQQLKSEMERIFETTKYNEKYIWQSEPVTVTTVDREITSTTYMQSVMITTPSTSIQIDNSNYDVISYVGYTTNADENGVSISWTGYNGTDYTTDKIGWDTLKANGYTFQIADYFDKSKTELFDATGKGVFDFTVSYDVIEQATVADIIKGIDGVKMGASTSTSMVGEYEDNNTHQVTICGQSLTYKAAYASRSNGLTSNSSNPFDFENDIDLYLEPNDSTNNDITNLIADPCKDFSDTVTADNVSIADTSTENWTFEFTMEGIGKVTATSSSVNYYAPSDVAADDENYWWSWCKHTDGTQHKSYITRSSSEYGSGTLGSVMAALTGKKGTTTPGLLTTANGGDCDYGGYIEIYFNLNAETAFTYGNNESSNDVGGFFLRIQADSTDTEESILQKIKNTLNGDTILDFKSGANVSSQYMYSWSENDSKIAINNYIENIEVDTTYPGVQIPIHSGADAEDKLIIKYDFLRLATIGLTDTNVLTEDAATQAIDEVSEALTKINRQRSVFGAYQNRLEHASQVNAVVAENTESAESVIRDTDMALEMVKYSNANILKQAAQSMLAQANQSTQLVLKLLGQ